MIKKGNDLRIGFHSIESIINHNPHKIKKIFLPSNRDDLRLNELISLIDKNDLKYEFSSKVKQEPEAIIANDPELNFKDFKDYLNSNLVNQPLILILDNVIDPRNLGACIRCAAVAGVDAMIINKHQCAPINAIAHKVSAGGVEVIKLFHVTNLVNCLKFLSEKNVNIYGLSEHASESYYESDFVPSTAIIMGAEESGIREKTLERCDYKINLSGNKLFKSFNVSVATGIILSEANRQRQNK
ncbi:23S rRNA (guanosine(2251)-2'-O)-methyltransferase RlmB [Gammaproteobacteria bacterium]|jgi:23S rRNA (guanosine2251-2'-O)-methyltransferase|nr:23S rRNA (guanosine(2251)-2'-O)-methyltransferase RlmB [Gammaproteobacteria bacterium]MDA9920509.1 23S rRNA (guanosine(2251)-2'-O)-methyltransferase RlmB [Gammaproteobacteria bacterium]MDB2448435.1 23S rRNA (guanosine(2251)-2'-O)-methyltransferase RlmB [Gammaproteobacteria bacterium]MDB2503490.1 23S rRNA (guanosine(2251)-2'-O)-methyltransferase RlmB [Gammaproteobacteria bacterium]MDB2604850.1 23S rRNA (guanosine(2251)-2'-O)-methyltransferase RlmB [Gammaproteobacteria bacterium]